MKILRLALTFFFISFIISCKESNIIGKWKRSGFTKYRRLLQNDTSSLGNLTISGDSTFFINGDGRKDIDTVPGWHTGVDFSGTWSIINKNLVFQYDPKENPFGLAFNIIRLTNRKLILVSTFDRKHKNKMKYKRI